MKNALIKATNLIPKEMCFVEAMNVLTPYDSFTTVIVRDLKQCIDSLDKSVVVHLTVNYINSNTGVLLTGEYNGAVTVRNGKMSE